MRPLITFILGTAATAVFSGCRTTPKLTPQQAEGKRLFAVGCAHCHVANSDYLNPPPPDLHGLFVRSTLPGGEPATDAAVEHVLMTGKGSMPSFAYQMTPQQMAEVIAYLHTDLPAAKSN